VTRLLRFLAILAEAIVLLVLVGIMALIIDERCSRNISADKTAGMAEAQQVPFKR
jgi:hypothetical protein